MTTIENITVYLGSSGRCRPIFKETAKQLGTLIGTHKKSLVYGGMDAGLMGIVANAALDSGAHVTGIIPKSLKDSERIHPNLNQTILVPDLWERKLKMFKRADAIIALAGGFGTIDELLEALYWADLGLHNKPVIIVNTDGYWNKFISYLKTLPDLAQNCLIIVDTPEQVFTAIEDFTPPEIKNPSGGHQNFEEQILLQNEEPLTIETASVKNGYFLATALGLKQLGKHNHHIGLLNDKGQFDDLLEWINIAQKEKFITDRCTELFSTAKTRTELTQKLDSQKKINIDLHIEKWGPGETKTHIEIKETK